MGHDHTTMPTRLIGRTDVRVTELGFVDPAPFYGRGLRERRVGLTRSAKVGRRLGPNDDARRDGFLSPMPFRVTYDDSRDGVLRPVEASMHRMDYYRCSIPGALWQVLATDGSVRGDAPLPGRDQPA